MPFLPWLIELLKGAATAAVTAKAVGMVKGDSSDADQLRRAEQNKLNYVSRLSGLNGAHAQTTAERLGVKTGNEN